MNVNLSDGCCQPCCGDGGVLPGGCCSPRGFSFETGGTGLFSTPGSFSNGGVGGGVHNNIPINLDPVPCAQWGLAAGDFAGFPFGAGGFAGYPPLDYRPVIFTLRYTDPTTGLDVCYDFLFAFQYECVDETHLRVRFLTPTNATTSAYHGTAPAGCAFLDAGASALRAALMAQGDQATITNNLQTVWDRIPHSTSGWQTVEFHPDPAGGGLCNGLGGYYDTVSTTMTLPAEAVTGVPSQTFTLDLDLGNFNHEYEDGICPSYLNFSNAAADGLPGGCCSSFDGSDVPGTNPGVPGGRVQTPCCGVGGATVAKVLTVVTNTFGVCPTLEFSIPISYQVALHAWVGTVIAGGNFVTVVFWCNAPASTEWFLYIFCGGVLIWGAAGAQFTGTTCNFLDMTAGPNTSDASPCCGSGVTLIGRVFDPTGV